MKNNENNIIIIMNNEINENNNEIIWIKMKIMSKWWNNEIMK